MGKPLLLPIHCYLDHSTGLRDFRLADRTLFLRYGISTSCVYLARPAERLRSFPISRPIWPCAGLSFLPLPRSVATFRILLFFSSCTCCHPPGSRSVSAPNPQRT